MKIYSAYAQYPEDHVPVSRKLSYKTRSIIWGALALLTLAAWQWVPVTAKGFTVSGVNGLCSSPLGLFAQSYSPEFQSRCTEYHTASVVLEVMLVCLTLVTAYHVYRLARARA